MRLKALALAVLLSTQVDAQTISLPLNSTEPKIGVISVYGALTTNAWGYFNGTNIAGGQVSSCWGDWCRPWPQSSFNANGGFIRFDTGTATEEWARANLDIVLSVNGKTLSTRMANVLASNAQIYNKTELSWELPKKNADGTTLSPLKYILVYYRSGSAPDENSANIMLRKDTVNYTFNNLAPGTWYFRISAVDTTEQESSLTQAISKTVY